MTLKPFPRWIRWIIGFPRPPHIVRLGGRTCPRAELLENRDSPSINGIDVSGPLNWALVDTSKYSFAYVKATDGIGPALHAEDANLDSNILGAVNRDIEVGLYHFAEPWLNKDGAKQEADWFANIFNAEKQAYPTAKWLRPALDIEDTVNSQNVVVNSPSWIGVPALNSWIQDWLDEVSAKTGSVPIIYTTLGYANLLSSTFRSYNLWIAAPGANPPSNTGLWGTSWDFWQSTPNTYLPGESNVYVDYDQFNGNLTDLESRLEGTPPVVNYFSVDKNSVPLESSVTLTYNVSDAGGSHLNRVELWRASDTGGDIGTWIRVATTDVSGDFPIEGKFTATPPDLGQWRYGIHVVDGAGNWNDELNSHGGGTEEFDAEVTATTTGAPTIGSLAITLNPVTIATNLTQQFTAIVKDIAGIILPPPEIAWASTIGTIDQNTGWFTSPISPGTGIVTATVTKADGTIISDSSQVTITDSNSIIQTQTNVSTSAISVMYGDAVTLYAFVNSNPPTMDMHTGGSVAFMDGGLELGVAPLNDGTATLSDVQLPIGNNSIVGIYGGDSSFSASTSAAQTVNVVPATTNVNASVPQLDYIAGQPETFSVTVSTSTSYLPTNEPVFLYDGSTYLGEEYLVASGLQSTASFTTTLPVGSHSITVSYGGDGFCGSGTSHPLAITVDPITTALGLTASPSTAVFGDAVSFTATMSVSTGAPPIGEVVYFYDGDILVGSENLQSNGSGAVATCSVSSLDVGIHEITAIYNGDSVFAASDSMAVTETIDAVHRAPSIVRVFSSKSPMPYGQPLTLSAVVFNLMTPPPGTVTFFDNGVQIGIGVFNGHVASLSNVSLDIGTHSIKAVYSGDPWNLGGTSAVFSQHVSRAVTETTLSPLSASTFGGAITMTASVTIISNSWIGVPTGAVQFKDLTTGKVLGEYILTTADNNKATITTTGTQLSGGNHRIVAIYVGNATLAGSRSASLVQTISKAATQVTLTPSALSDQLSFGDRLTLTATVSAASSNSAGQPTGTVTFWDGSVRFGVAHLNSNGQAILTTSRLSAGTHTIRVQYSGSTNFLTSANTLAYTIMPTDTVVALTSATKYWTTSQLVVFHVSATSATGVVPLGNVVLQVDSPSGPVTLPAKALVNGKATLSFRFPNVMGPYSFSAEYIPANSNFVKAISDSMTQSVRRLSRITLVKTPSATVFAGQDVTLSATVQGAGGQPTGGITFYDNGVAIGSEAIDADGTATIIAGPMTAGYHIFEVVYEGDLSFSPSLASKTLLVKVRGRFV